MHQSKGRSSLRISSRKTARYLSAATPETVLAALKGKTHWHFSTHATFNREEPRRSALAMKGGATLSVGSLLEADDLGRPRLVVLSACETGLHDIDRTPEEFIGLPGAFMTIGARAVLGTLWPVDDRATAMLTARFYDLHLSEGLAPATALRKAQLWLKSATREDLARYARAAETQGHLSAHQARQLELALAGAAGEGVRFFGVANPETTKGSDRPVAHLRVQVTVRGPIGRLHTRFIGADLSLPGFNAHAADAHASAFKPSSLATPQSRHKTKRSPRCSRQGAFLDRLRAERSRLFAQRDLLTEQQVAGRRFTS